MDWEEPSCSRPYRDSGNRAGETLNFDSSSEPSEGEPQGLDASDLQVMLVASTIIENKIISSHQSMLHVCEGRSIYSGRLHANSNRSNEQHDCSCLSATVMLPAVTSVNNQIESCC